MGNLTETIEQRYRLPAGKGRRFYPVLILHIVVLATAFFGLALSYTLLLSNTGPNSLPWAFFTAGVVVVVGMAASELLERRFSAGTVYLGLVVVTLLGALAARLMLPVAWVAGSFLAFVVAEASFLLLVRRLRSIALTAFDELEWSRLMGLFLSIQSLGGVVGAALIIPFVLTGTYLGAAFTWVVLLGLTVIAVSVVESLMPLQRPPAHLPPSRWRAIIRAYPMVGVLVGVAIWGRVLRYLIQGTTLTFWAHALPFDQLGLAIALILLVNAVLVVVVALSTSWISARLGAGLVGLIYPVAVMVLLALWWLLPGSWAVVALLSFTWTTLVPGVALGFTRQAMVILPRLFIQPLRTLLFIICAAVGALLGGVALLLLPLPLDGIVPIAMTFGGALLAILLALLAAWAFQVQWRQTLAGRGLEAETVEEIEGRGPASHEEISALLLSDDPELLRVGFVLAARTREPVEYAEEVEAALPRAATVASRAAAREFLGHVPAERLTAMIGADHRRQRARALGAVARHRIPVGIAPITTALRDEDAWVRLIACAAAWRLGMAKLAEVTWDSLELSEVGEEGLIEFLEIIHRGAPTQTIKVLKQLCHFPAPRVRELAMPALALALQGVTEGHADVLEAAISGASHEVAEVRAAAVDLLVASGTDNAADHLARLLEDEAEIVQVAAARGLSQLGAAGIDVAQAALADTRPWVVAAALRALGGAGRAGREVFERWLQPRLENFAAAQNLPWPLRFGDGIWLPMSTAMHNREQRLQKYVVSALHGMGRTEAARALSLLMGELVSDVRRQLCEVFRRRAPRRWAKALLPSLRDPHPAPRDVDPHHPLVVAYLKRAMTQSVDPFLQIGAQMLWAAIEDEEPPEPSKELPMNHLLFLKNIPYFEGLLLEELLVIDERLMQETYTRGETIFKEGAQGDRFYIIWEGSVDLFRGDTKIATLEQGAHFAEMAIFEDAPRSATAVAATPVTLLALQKQAFQTLVLQRPTILLHICQELSHRLRIATAAMV